jgi:hypothetical protein
MFLRDRSNQPVGCLAIELTRSRKSAKYQVSVLNPVDKFDRSLARQIALGRLVEDSFTAPLSTKDVDMNQISTDVMTSLSKNKFVPSRASRAAARWLKNKPTK